MAKFPHRPLIEYGSYLLLGMLVLLVLFYRLRGKISIDGPKTGRTILLFTSIERFGHWLLVGSFILLAITGLLSLFGRKFLLRWASARRQSPLEFVNRGACA